MSNPSLYVYLHIIFSTLQEVTSDNEAGNVAFDFRLIYLLILCYFCLFVTTKCYLFPFSFYISITLLFLSFLSSCCLFMSVYIFYLFISFLHIEWVMTPVWLWLECCFGFCNSKWGKCFVKNTYHLLMSKLWITTHYSTPWYWEEEDKKSSKKSCLSVACLMCVFTRP
jgi:hypothetical protein